MYPPPLCGYTMCSRVQETHYILVVHGTFDAPNPLNDPPKWYQLDPMNPDNFCTMLQLNIDHLQDVARAQREASGKAQPPEADRQQYGVWRKLPGELPEELKAIDPNHELWCAFTWDGENSDASRVKAGLRLGKLLHFLATNDPSARIHVVAHSHGGNVLLKVRPESLCSLGSPQRHVVAHSPYKLSVRPRLCIACSCTVLYRTIVTFIVGSPVAGGGDVHERALSAIPGPVAPCHQVSPTPRS